MGYDAAQSNVELPEEIQTALTDIEQKIADGSLVPPETQEELDAWTAANQYGK